jgi:hypothetical protein
VEVKEVKVTEKNEKTENTHIGEIKDEKGKTWKVCAPRCGYCEEEIPSLDPADFIRHRQNCSGTKK